jgi:ATP-dependent Clp protease ATP-binding subunit ClpC
MTSNIGAELIRKGNTLGFVSRSDEGKVQQKSYDRMKENLLGELKKTFRPEFINRIDGVVVFHPLDSDQIREIVDLMLSSVTKQMEEKGIKLEITGAAKNLLGNKGYDEVFGARPLRRTIQDLVEDRLSEALLRAEFGNGDTVVIDLAENGEELSVVVKKLTEPALSGAKTE